MERLQDSNNIMTLVQLLKEGKSLMWNTQMDKEDAVIKSIHKMGMKPNLSLLDGMWLEYGSPEACVWIWASAWIDTL